LLDCLDKGVGRNICRRANGKKDQKLLLLSLFQGGTKKDRKIAKKIPKNSTIKPLSTISVPRGATRILLGRRGLENGKFL